MLCVVSCRARAVHRVLRSFSRPVRRYAELQDSGVQGRVRDQLLGHLGCMLCTDAAAVATQPGQVVRQPQGGAGDRAGPQEVGHLRLLADQPVKETTKCPPRTIYLYNRQQLHPFTIQEGARCCVPHAHVSRRNKTRTRVRGSLGEAWLHGAALLLGRGAGTQRHAGRLGLCALGLEDLPDSRQERLIHPFTCAWSTAHARTVVSRPVREQGPECC